jgi:hypothetical protein
MWRREKSLAPARNQTPTVQPVAHHYIAWAIVAHEIHMKQTNALGKISKPYWEGGVEHLYLFHQSSFNLKACGNYGDNFALKG